MKDCECVLEPGTKTNERITNICSEIRRKMYIATIQCRIVTIKPPACQMIPRILNFEILSGDLIYSFPKVTKEALKPKVECKIMSSFYQKYESTV